jgi:hypothetical protein
MRIGFEWNEGRWIKYLDNAAAALAVKRACRVGEAEGVCAEKKAVGRSSLIRHHVLEGLDI